MPDTRARKQVRVKARVRGATSGATGSKKPRVVEGERLIRLVIEAASAKNMTERELTDKLEVSPAYWNSLTNGNRPISSLPKEKMQEVADLIGIPVVQAYALAGLFAPADFVVTTDLDRVLKKSIEKMRHDVRWRSMAPTAADWQAVPTNVKITLVSLYEYVSNSELLEAVRVYDPKLRR